MSAQRRITKRDMKEDKLVTATFQVTEYVQNHKQHFIIGLAVIISIAAIAYFISVSNANKNAEAVISLGTGDFSLLKGDIPSAIAEYEQTKADYGNTLSGRKAYILLGKSLANTGEYLRAKEIFVEYIDNFANKEPILLYRAALAGAALTSKNLGETAEAAEYYIKASEQSMDELEKGYFLLDAARCYAEIGERDKAIEIYTQLEKAYERKKIGILAKGEIWDVKTN